MIADFAQEIESWYRQHGRLLPWRETHDAYRIWVSEIILQQTRVAQGIDYYHRFIGRFPDVKALAEATEDEVLRLWQGLGYYSRARNMHRAAQQVMELGGTFPQTYEGVRALKGVGDYTAAAIMSFAYDRPYAVVDGNVFRILARTQGIDTPIDTAQGKKMFTALAQELLDRKHPSLYNQAIMDFGAIQCTPKGYQCESCPLRLTCVACREGRVEEYPVKSHRVSIRQRHFTYFYIHDKSHLLLRRRGEGDIWQGLYEMPMVETDKSQSSAQWLKQPWLKHLLAMEAVLTHKASGLHHQLTHQTISVDFYEISVPFALEGEQEMDSAGPFLSDYRAVPLASLDDYGMPKLVLQLLSMCE